MTIIITIGKNKSKTAIHDVECITRANFGVGFCNLLAANGEGWGGKMTQAPATLIDPAAPQASPAGAAQPRFGQTTCCLLSVPGKV